MVKIGEKRFFLTLKEKIKTGEKITHFLCLCDCGQLTKINRSKFGLTKSCGCRLSVKWEKNPNWTGYGKLQGGIWEQYVRNAKKRKISFDLSIKDAWEAFESQHGKCAITNVEIKLGRRHREETTASLDRIDNKIGYKKNNVHWVHKKINQIKMDMPLDEFISWCERVTNANRK